MAQVRTQAWITYATQNEHVTQAKVLAKSLRRSRTNRRIGVVTSASISNEGRISLRHSFDDVIFLDYQNEPGNEEIRSKIFAFSLEIFEKCIFIEPNSILLENGDMIFQREGRIVPLVNEIGLGRGGGCFLFMPCLPFADYLGHQLGERNGTWEGGFLEEASNYANKWFMNNRGLGGRVVMEDEGKERVENFVMRLSVKTGQLLKKEHWNRPKIIEFVNSPEKEEEFLEKLSDLRKREDLGATEQMIIQTWLRIRKELCEVPSSAVSPSFSNLDLFTNEPIAIIGISCRLPGANSLEEFWNLLYSSKDGVKELPPFRWRKEHVFRLVTENERKTQAGFLNSTVDEFDAKFFGVSPKEAEYMDPQTRLMHEVMWESLENGGVDPSSLYGSYTGIFTGSWMNDYRDIVQCSSSKDFFRTYMGNSIGASVARLSFLLGLTGPCIATESGCSSAIVAVDMAVKSLRSGETNMALVGGVNLLLHPFSSTIMDYVISPDGRCKTFDAKADGFGRAEGCGFLVLKRLSDALRDNDHIWAMIRGSAVSQEGVSRSLGTPTVHCESLAMELALKNGGVYPEQVTFVETHGTGTSVGDPMEVAAIAKAYHSKYRKNPLVIGSVKTNVGHTESCSGITGIIKTVLAMKHQMIPKHLNLETLNPEINLDTIPAQIPLQPIPWPRIKGEPRFAGVSSFGITGTDGHVIVQEPPDFQLPKFTLNLERPLHILKISAKTKDAFQEMVKNYEQVFASSIDTETFENIAFTANTGRASFEHRAFLLASNFEAAVDAIQGRKFVRGEVGSGGGDDKQKICFLFTGQGSQYPGMAKTLYETSPVFRHHFDHCSHTLEHLYKISLPKVIWGSDSKTELSRTLYSQTSIFCVEYCLLRLWESWGLKPDVVLGHSLGEFCAAVAAGFLEFTDALKLVTIRTILIDRLQRGSMLVLKAKRKQVEDAMKKSGICVDFAAVNSAEQTVVSGDTEKISHFLELCKAEGLKGIILDATHAFHSSHMDAMLDEYRTVAERIIYGQGNPRIQYVSGVEGTLVHELDADYWVRHTRCQVSFLDACQTLKQLECHNFLELGPHPVLSTFVLQNLEDTHKQIACYSSLRRQTNDWETILTSLGKLWLQGFNINWFGFDEPYTRKKVPSLPFYPFQRKPFWVEVNEPASPIIHPLIGGHLSNASNLNIFENNLNVNTVPYLKDHCIGQKIVFPGAAFSEMCLAGGYCVANFLREKLEKPRGPVALEDLRIEAPLELREGKLRKLQVIIDLQEKETNGQVSQGFRCRVFHKNSSDTESQSAGKWVSHATATFYPNVAGTKDMLQEWAGGARMKQLISSSNSLQMEGFYKRIDGVGLKFGETFRSIQRHWAVAQEDIGGGGVVDEVVTQIKLPQDFDMYLLHPVVIDAMFQTQILAGLRSHKSDALKVPVAVGRLILFGNSLEEKNNTHDGLEGTSPSVLYVHAKWKDRARCSITLTSASFSPIALMENVELLETNVKTIQSVLEQQNSRIPDCWEEIWKPIHGPHDKRLQLAEIAPVISSQEFKESLQSASVVVPEDAIHAKNVARLVTLYSLQAFYRLGWQPVKGEELTALQLCQKLEIKERHCQLVYFYFTMMENELKMLEEVDSIDGGLWRVTKIPFKSEKEISSEVSRLHETLLQVNTITGVAKIYHHIAKNLPKILKGEESALQILFPVEPEKQEFSAETYYQKYPGREDMVSLIRQVFATHWGRLRNINGGAESDKVFRILEVGAGTGSLSIVSLTELRRIYGRQFEYWYTDISASFFAKADKHFEEFRDNIKYTTFNIEEAPLGQGIPVNHFDCVMATDVFHTTRDLKEAIQNVRVTLRPKGLLIFTESLVPDNEITFVFGLLDGYWRFQDFHRRPHHSCVSAQVWRNLMLESGFSDFHCVEGYFGVMGTITGEASTLPGYDEVEAGSDNAMTGMTRVKRKRWIIFSPDEEEMDIMLRVSKVLTCGGNNVDVVIPSRELEEDESGQRINALLRGKHNEEDLHGIIYAWGMKIGVHEQKKFCLPFLHICKFLLEEKFLPKLFVFTKNVHAISEAPNNPSPATLYGMAKSLKNENSDLFVRCIDLEGNETSGGDVTTDQILYELAMIKETRERERVQVAYRDDTRHEPKFVKVQVEQQSKSDLSLPPSTDRFQLLLPQTRLINDLEFGALEVEPIGEEEVEVKTNAYALNFRDILTILKPIPEFEKFNTVGLDFSGVVVKVGEGVKRLKVGDRVFGANLKEAQLPSHLITNEANLLKIPEAITFGEAATLPAVFATSIYCLLYVARLQKGETVLIHTGSGGVGLSAIQVARKIGANVITTAGSPRKRAYLRNLGLQHVFHSRNTSYQEEIMKVTGGRGVDVVLNSITGPGLKEASLAVCSEKARFIEMSKLAIWTEKEVKERRPDVQYSIVDLTTLDSSIWAELLEKTSEYLDKKEVTPIPYVKFDALRIRQALQYFQKAKHIGKVVLTMPEVKTEQGEWRVKVPLFNDDSTYLITGGLGGIGFEVCKWMLENGATNVVLIGRNLPNPEIEGQIENLNKRRGVQVTAKLCDVGSYEQCKMIVEELTNPECGFKPLRGIHHCAGILWDNLYYNQTWDSFTATFNPKVEGSWNLHRLTINVPLEHFVFYSSLTALVGTPGQANHASANCFEDAFARYRYSLGLPATTVNWGQWAQVGCAKEVNVTAVLPVSVARMLNGLEEVLRSQRVQVAFGDFESLSMWTIACPYFKYYLDERLLKSSSESSAQDESILLQSAKFWQEMDEVESTQDKMEIVMNYMRVILRAALRMDPSELIKEDANMQDLGVDSLMLIELRNSIQSLLGSKLIVTASMLKDCQTIRQLSTVIVNNIQEEQPEAAPLTAEELEELLKEDSILEEDIVPTGQACSWSSIKSVLVTGVTGQLGPYVLSTLCERLEKIICLVRTREDGPSPKERLTQILDSMELLNKVDMAKVECIRGCVSKEMFALDPDVYKELCERVDGVIHLAVKSNHVEPYTKIPDGATERSSFDVRSVNVGGTRRILRFCVTGKTKPIYYASSILAVLGGHTERNFSDDWPTSQEATTLAENGIPAYPCSKYVCEMLFKQAEERGLPCKLFRFPWILGDSHTGRLNYQSNHYILRLITYLKLKAMPSSPLPAVVLPVDICAEWSASVFWMDDAPNGIYNITHPTPDLEVEFVDVAKEDFGMDMELVEWKSGKFMEKLYASDMPLVALKEIYNDMEMIIAIMTSKSFQLVQGYLNYPDNFFQNRKLETLLPGIDKHLPSTTEIIRSNINFVRSAGGLVKFGL